MWSAQLCIGTLPEGKSRRALNAVTVMRPWPDPNLSGDAGFLLERQRNTRDIWLGLAKNIKHKFHADDAMLLPLGLAPNDERRTYTEY
jgi:hypothetical protein